MINKLDDIGNEYQLYGDRVISLVKGKSNNVTLLEVKNGLGLELEINLDRGFDITSLKRELQDIMWRGAGIVRSEKTLVAALDEIYQLAKKFPRSVKCLNKEEYEFKNMLLVSELIINAALQRKESRGAHYRLDYLNTDENGVHSVIKRAKGELSFVG